MSNAFRRKTSLFLFASNPNQQGVLNQAGTKGLDLSGMQFKFQTQQSDSESPNSVVIRVYNLKSETVTKIGGEFSYVVLQAGYEDGPYGVVFQGQVRQWRLGKEKNTDTYLDILASDGDEWYNFGAVSTSIEVGSTSPVAQANAILAGGQADGASMHGVQPGYLAAESFADAQGNQTALSRGKVFFGAARVAMRSVVQSYGSTYNINNGRINIIPLTGYLPSTPVELNSRTGLIGRAEQTIDGVKFRALLNPLLTPGGLVKIDNKSLNATLQQDANNPRPYNQRTGITSLASINADGLYRIYVAEFIGNTRGQEWYVDLIGLAVEPSGKEVKAYP